MLACARIGAAHSVVFGGFSSQSLSDRINDAEAKVLITADGGYRRGEVFPLKPAADEALADDADDRARRRRAPRRQRRRRWIDGRDHWYHDLIAAADADCPAEPMDTEQLLFLLYTSGTTGKPKGIMHTTGGYLTQVAFTHKYVFDLHPETDVYWCTADVGWVTGHSYIVYGPLANGATHVMYEGVPNHPGNDRFWAIVEKYGVTIFYTAPTAIRTFMKWGAEEPAKHDLSSLRVLGIGRRADQPRGVDVVPRAHRRRALPDRRHVVADRDRRDHDQPAARGDDDQAGLGDVPAAGHHAPRWSTTPASRSTRGGGYLTLTRPWPAMLRGIWGDPERYRETYWSRFPGRYFAGDGAKLDDDGYLWLLGRVDDVMNVSRPPHLDDRGRVGARVAPRRRRGRRRRRQRRDDRAGDHRLRDPARRVRASTSRTLRDHVGHGDRRDRQAEDDLLHARPAEDPQRQDHAPPAARRRRGPQPRRHDDARRRHRRRRAPAPGHRDAARGLTPGGRQLA